ncbi:hypothetical protein DPMN_034698 [Dreissena polymorpha]|uniref:Uncharacterized protein n=1 Tax=Dreissena polymorpha TaxID=45954 RepID=A0A9D4M851_DREPO|nr:hypothetical protein DPMN_034698 [Dreissena polymorpha]
MWKKFTPQSVAHLRKQDIIGTNLLTKYHEDRKINVASRVKNAPPPGSHVFQPTGIIFELVQDIIGMNLLTKCHEDRTVNVLSRVLTGFYYSHIRKNAPPLGSHVFRANIIIFKFIQDIIETNLLTKFHEDWTINGASRELTRQILEINVASRVLTRKNAPPLFHDDRKIYVTSRVLTSGGHVFQPTGIIFELVQDIIGMNLLTEFQEDRTINFASRVKNAPPIGSHFHDDRKINVASRVLTRKCPVTWPPYIIGTNLLTKFHEGRTINVASREKNALPLGSHVFQAKTTIFELIQDIIWTNLLSKFHEDRKINMASRVLTRFNYSHIWKNAPPPGGHMNLLTKFHEDQTINVASRVRVFQANVTIFELIQDIIETNLLTKFHEDWTINVASRELTRQMLTPRNGRRTKGNHKSSP